MLSQFFQVRTPLLCVLPLCFQRLHLGSRSAHVGLEPAVLGGCLPRTRSVAEWPTQHGRSARTLCWSWSGSISTGCCARKRRRPASRTHSPPGSHCATEWRSQLQPGAVDRNSSCRPSRPPKERRPPIRRPPSVEHRRTVPQPDPISMRVAPPAGVSRACQPKAEVGRRALREPVRPPPVWDRRRLPRCRRRRC